MGAVRACSKLWHAKKSEICSWYSRVSKILRVMLESIVTERAEMMKLYIELVLFQ